MQGRRGEVVEGNTKLCGEYLQCYLVTIAYHLQRSRLKQRESWLIYFPLFLSFTLRRRRRAKVEKSCSLSFSAWQDTGRDTGHEGDRWQMKTIASAKAKEIKYSKKERKKERSERASEGEKKREKEEILFQIEKGNVFFFFFVKEQRWKG